jgi:glycosyltransferase involved in cell wall biosynthesis
MNILFVSAVLPYPLHSGGQTRIYHLLKRLSRSHSITLLSYIRDENERDYAHELSFCREVVMIRRGGVWQPTYVGKSLFGGYPLLLSSYDNEKMRRAIAVRLEKTQYDLLHLEPFYVLPGIPKHLLPTVVAEHNIEYDVYRQYVSLFPVPFLRPLLSFDVEKIRRWERHAWRTADSVISVSREDADVIERYLSHEIAVVPNGVDSGQFKFRTPSSGHRALFVGNYKWLPNVQAATELLSVIWPAIKKRFPDATLTIAGRHVTPKLIGLALGVGATVAADVSDIYPLYRDHDLFLAPLGISGGTKFKMLEAMATGIPVVTTVEGMGGIGAEDGTHYLAARTGDEFVAKAAEIWENRQVRESLANRARELVERSFSWDSISRGLETVWKKTYAKHKKR